MRSSFAQWSVAIARTWSGKRRTCCARSVTFAAPVSGAPFTSANGFVAGRRLHLGNGDSGVWAGDYTIDKVDPLGHYIVLAETLPTGISLTTEQVPAATQSPSIAQV